MASIGSLQLLVDTKVGGTVLLQCNDHGRPRFRLFAYRPRKSLETDGSVGLENSYALVGLCNGVAGSYNRRKLRRNEPLRVMSNKGSEEDESGYEPEDKLQTTIEKSKKVLEMQRELLKQIAERKKLVSSIKNSSVDMDEEEASFDEEQGGSSLTNTSLASVNDDKSTVPNQSGSILSSTFDDSAAELKPETFPFSGNGGIYKRERVENRAVGKDYDKQLENPTLDADHLPSFVSVTSGTSVRENEKFVDLKESSPNVVNNEANDPVSDEAKPPSLAGTNVMNVIFVAAECAPWSKTGGLGDVSGSLPTALARRGHRVMVVAPRYGNYVEPKDTGVRKRYKVVAQDMEVTYFQAYKDGVDFVFIDNPIFHHFENNIYGGDRMEILKRMILFCKAAVEVPWYVPCGGVVYGDGNLAFIANDWHTALLPVYLKAYYRDNGLMMYTRSILVIHNIAHQGRGPLDDFPIVDLPQHYIDLFRLYDPVGGEHFNIFAAGLKAADRVVTVSHGYAWELKTQQGGWGLHGIINENDWKLRGIVNGIDTKEWSPQYDVHLTSDGYTNYSLETLQTGKPLCKTALQKELGLPVRYDVPLIGFIGRLDNQKGVDIIAEAIPWMMGQDVQLVMLGTGRPDLEQMLRMFESQHKDKVRGWVGFSVKTAHRITAGADILLMPSRFEPCGLNQLYAMSYGTIPVVHAVGGLRDTVQPFNPFEESGLGWLFDSADAGKLTNALGNCIWTYREYKKSWEGLQRRGMMQDLSWDNAAQHYEEVLVAAKYQW